MKIIKRDILANFKSKHADARKPLETWEAIVSLSSWETPSDIKEVFGSADFLPGNRVVFNIKGNHYRLVVEVLYTRGAVAILRVGKHSEYSKWDL